MRALILLAIAACGGSSRPNHMIDAPSRLHELGAPHLAIYVDTSDGVERVWLDTGARELIAHTSSALIVDDHTFVTLDATTQRYVLVRDGARIPIAAKGTYGSSVSPDHRWLAIAASIDPAPLDKTQPTDKIVIASLVDGTTREFVLANSGPERPSLWLRWANTSDAVLASYGGYQRLDLATGAFTPITATDYDVDGRLPSTTECPARGVRATVRIAKGTQQLVLVPTSSTVDPEHLSATTDRVLASATNRSRYLGEGGHHLGFVDAGPLEVAFFTPTCEHVVFTLQDGVYIANVATGRFALVARGAAPQLPHDVRVTRRAAP